MANGNTPFNTSTIIRCGTTEYMNKLKAEDPTLEGRLDAFELQAQQYIKTNNTSDSVCFGENKGDVITYPYNGVERRFRLISDVNKVFCYKLILGA